MKLPTKIKEAVKKELLGYSEQRKRKYIICLMIAFFVLIVLNFNITYLKLFKTKEIVNTQKTQAIKGLDKLENKPVSHQEMIHNLQQMKNDIKKQRKSYEKTFH